MIPASEPAHVRRLDLAACEHSFTFVRPLRRGNYKFIDGRRNGGLTFFGRSRPGLGRRGGFHTFPPVVDSTCRLSDSASVAAGGSRREGTRGQAALEDIIDKVNCVTDID